MLTSTLLSPFEKHFTTLSLRLDAAEKHLDNVDQRLDKLTASVDSLKIDVAIIKEDYTTRAYLHQQFERQTLWLVGTMLATASCCMALAKLMF